MNNNYFINKERTAIKRAHRVELIQSVLLGVVFFFLIFGVSGIAGGIESHYTMKGIVLSSSADEIIVRDKTGEEWGFYGDGFTAGDNVRITFFTNGTDNNREDDEITNVKVIDK